MSRTVPTRLRDPRGKNQELKKFVMLPYRSVAMMSLKLTGKRPSREDVPSCVRYDEKYGKDWFRYGYTTTDITRLVSHSNASGKPAIPPTSGMTIAGPRVIDKTRSQMSEQCMNDANKLNKSWQSKLKRNLLLSTAGLFYVVYYLGTQNK